MRKENGKGELHKKTGISFIVLLVFVAIALTGINACGYLGIFGEASWKEEVLLHDGSKIIAKRWQKHKGRYAPDQTSPIGEQSIKFTLPGTKKTIMWGDEYSKEIGCSNFIVVALHILNDVPYMITTPRLCLSYNKWGRPNPPYVIFKYEKDTWQRIEMAELPTEFKNINVVIETKGDEKKLLNMGLVSVEKVKELNSSLKQPEFKTIVRTPIVIWCEKLVTDGKGTWMGIGWFKDQSSYEACLNVCNRERFSAEYCPCKNLFKIDSKGGK